MVFHWIHGIFPLVMTNMFGMEAMAIEVISEFTQKEMLDLSIVLCKRFTRG